MKYYFSIIVLILFSLKIVSQDNENNNCYTIIVGTDASFDGSVLVGHNEDDKGKMLVNWFKVPSKNFKENDSIILQSGKNFKHLKKTESYIRLQICDEKFGDAFLNEHSVLICSNACRSKEDTAMGYIGFDFRLILAEQAKTAKDAVLIGGKLIETFGYESSGRTYTIADQNEAWMMSIVKGKRWIAQRVPDSCVAIIPNYYTIQEVNLTDTNNFLASSDIIEYACLRGWYNSNRVFNFREVYGDSATNCADYNIPRHLSGLNFLSEKKYYPENVLPFSFVPKKKINISDIKDILSSHYEDDVNFKPCNQGNPHNCSTLPVCRPDTKFSFVAQLRSNLPDMLGSLLWISPYNGCIFPYIPLYSGIFSTHEFIGQNNINKADSIHFDKNKNQIEYYPDHSYYIFLKYKEYVEGNYIENIKKSHIYKQKIESELEQNLLKLEASVRQVYDSYPDDARKLLTHYCEGYIQVITEYYKTLLKQKNI